MAHIKQKCDFCDSPAVYDAKTKLGPWAFVCQQHFTTYGVKHEGMYTVLEPAVILKKKCTSCGEEKATTEFYQYTDKRGVKRFRSECKSCNLTGRKVHRMKGGK